MIHETDNIEDQISNLPTGKLMSHISIISTMTIDCTNIDENIIKYLKAK
jgi:hypothetical protein